MVYLGLTMGKHEIPARNPEISSERTVLRDANSRQTAVNRPESSIFRLNFISWKLQANIVTMKQQQPDFPGCPLAGCFECGQITPVLAAQNSTTTLKIPTTLAAKRIDVL